MKRPAIVLGLVALAAVLAACSGAAAAPSTPPASAPAGGTGTTATVVAKDLKFQPEALTVKAGEAFVLVLDNQDSAPHNIKVSDASGAEVFKGEIVTSTKVDNAIPALAAGTYPFICEVHPDMKGTITAQ
jgi:plastocyanin